MNSLDKYKQLTDIEKEYINDYQYYQSIYFYNKEATDDDVLFIKTLCEEVYLKDEIGYSINKITDFIADNYFNKRITKEELLNSSKWNILTAVSEDNIEFLKKA